MGPTAVELVAGVIDRMEWAIAGPGRPPVPTNTVLETLRFFLRQGVQWRELRASPERAYEAVRDDEDGRSGKQG